MSRRRLKRPKRSLAELRRLYDETGLWMENFPCPQCGAEKPTPEGHDPCIGNLPGVAFACCGHGVEPGYVSFGATGWPDGRVIRGWFDHIAWPEKP